MDIIAGVIELKPNSLGLVDKWAKTLNERIDETVATLKDEGVTLESWFHLELEGKDYLLSYMRAESLEKAHEAAKHSTHDIDAIHQQFKKDTWAKGTRAKLLLDIVGEKEA